MNLDMENQPPSNTTAGVHPRQQRRQAIALLCVLVLALALRLWGIGWGLPSSHRRSVSYHPDENTYLWRIATSVNISERDFVIDARGQAVVYYTLAALLAAADLVGWFELQPSEDFYIAHPEEAAKMYLMGRAISIVSGMLSIVLIYMIIRKAFERAPWWLAPLGALFLTIAPGHVHSCHYLQTNVPVTFFILLTLYLLIDLVRLGRLSDYCLVGVSTGLAIGTKWSALPLLLLLLIAHCMRQPVWWRPKAFVGKEQFKRLLIMGLSLAFAFFLTNPYVALNLVDSTQHVDQMSDAFFTDVGLGSFVTRLVGVLINTMPASLGWGVYCLGFLGAVLALVDRRRKPIEVLVLLWILVFGIIAANIYSPTVGRLQPLTACLGLLAISAIARLQTWTISSRLKSAALTGAIVLSVCLALGGSIITDLFLCCFDTTRQDASHWIMANVPPGARFGLYGQEPYADDPDILYQDFYHPSDGRSRYQYEIYSLDASDPPRPDSEYLVFTPRDTRKINSFLTPEQATDLSDWMEQHYEVAAEFESVVRVSGFDLRGLQMHFGLNTSLIQILEWSEGE